MNNAAFYARVRTGRKLAGITRRMGDGWAAAQAQEYARSGYIGPDLGPWLDWYWGRREDAPTPSFGSLAAAKGQA